LISKKNNYEKGMVTIEATLALTTYLFVFMMIFSIITICRAQAKIQVALNNTCQEISQYSYLYGLSGLDESLAKFQTEANNTKSDINGLTGNVIDVFESIQTLRKDASEAVEKTDITNPTAMMTEWENLATDLKDVENTSLAAKEKLAEMAENPQQLLFGMAKLIGSEALEVGKSKLIAAPITRALMKKHLKRNDSDTAENFCRSVGIVDGYDGIKFDNSTLFPYGSPEITLVASYKIKMLKLLPIDVEFSITQSAKAKGWLHGDASSVPAAEVVKYEQTNESVWNKNSISNRNTVIRKLELDELKTKGYAGVSGETYVQAYNEDTNTFVFIATANPMYEATSVDNINKDDVKEALKRQAAQINSATDNRYYVTIKEKDAKGNITTRKIDCSKQTINKKIILVVPDDPGLEEAMQTIIDECGYSSLFELKAGYGTGKKYVESDGDK